MSGAASAGGTAGPSHQRWRRAGGLLALAALACPAASLAQQTSTLLTATQTAGDYAIVVDRPNLAQDKHELICQAGAATCLKFNREMCRKDYPHVPIRLVVRRGATAVAAAANNTNPRHKAYAWLQRRSGVCTSVPPSADQPNWPAQLASTRLDLSTASSLVGPTGAAPMIVPDDLVGWGEDKAGTSLSTADIIGAFPEACSLPGVSPTRWRLCVGVDLADYGVINSQAAAGQASSGGTTTGTTGSSTSSTPTAWVEFMIATIRPPAPQVLAAEARHEAVELTLRLQNPDQTVRAAGVQFSARAELQQRPCGLWTGEVQEVEQAVAAVSASDTSVTLRVPGDAGVAYSYCAFTRDLADNVSLSDSAVLPTLASPTFESGPFTATHDLSGGYGCRAGGGLWPLGAALGALLRRRRRGLGAAGPSARPWSAPRWF